MKKTLPFLLVISVMANFGLGIATTTFYNKHTGLSEKLDRCINIAKQKEESAQEQEVLKHECNVQLEKVNMQLEACQTK